MDDEDEFIGMIGTFVLPGDANFRGRIISVGGPWWEIESRSGARTFINMRRVLHFSVRKME